MILLRLCIGGVIIAARCLADEGSQSSSAPHTAISEPIVTGKVAETSPIVFTSSDRPTSSIPTSTGTCPSRTINYVLHTLAQQCLRTDWSRTRNQTHSSTTFNATSYRTPVISTSLQLSEAGPTASSIPVAIPTDLSSTTLVASETSTSVDNTDEGRLSAHNPSTETVDEPESPLDTANFLSFEEWKKQNLAKAGQSSDTVGARGPIEPGRKAPVINALDSFGDENEIDLGFTGFGGAAVYADGQQASSRDRAPSSTDSGVIAETSPASQALRPRDAGRTCKERTNYASFDCAATVLKSNPECKSASSVLVENKDSYMLNKCSAKNKFFIVELCNDILIDTIVLANYEFFSSIFHQFRVSVSDRYPVKAEKWKDLGTFEARNTREVQAFLVQNPLIWARYLLIEFLTHYGSEYYCPVSLLRVHGTTMMEEFRNQEELARGEGDVQDEEPAVDIVEPATITASDDGRLMKPDTALKSHSSKQTSMAAMQASGIGSEQTESMTVRTPPQGDYQTVRTRSEREDQTTATSPADSLFAFDHSTCSATTSSSMPLKSAMIGSSENSKTESSQVPNTSDSSAISKVKSITLSKSTRTAITSSTNNNSEKADTVLGNTSALSQSSVSINSSVSDNIISTSIQQSVRPADISSTHGKDTSLRSTATDSTKVAPATTASHQAQPSTQESFFKSISKRLQQLESNSTLSLQYIEAQSRILRDAFGKVERRQVNMTTSFLSNLNKTVMAELAGFRQAYDQLWQSTVIELEGQREQHKHEMTALSSRLTLVVDELVWQKRMGIVQSTLLLLCLALVLFGRNSSGTSDASLMQQVMLRSQSAFRSAPNSEVNSPAGSRSPVSLFRHKLPLWRGGANAKDSDIEPHSRTSSAEDSPGSQVEFHIPKQEYDEISGDSASEPESGSDLDDDDL